MQGFARNVLTPLAFSCLGAEFENPVRGLQFQVMSESGMHMAIKTFGRPLRRPAPAAELTSTDGQEKPGLGWQISAQTRQEIEEIEANSRAAEQQSGSVVFG